MKYSVFLKNTKNKSTIFKQAFEIDIYKQTTKIFMPMNPE